MRHFWTRVAGLGAAVSALTLTVLLAHGGLGIDSNGSPALGDAPSNSNRLPSSHPRGKLANCANHSEADFPGAFSDPRNIVVGPLVLVGAAYTSPEVIREFGGNKFPALVAAGHTVTVHLPKKFRRRTSLGWAPRRKTPRRIARRTVNFVACRPNQNSGSHADGRKVTFWSGGIATRKLQCLPLKLFVDDEPEPRRAFLELGRRCESQASN